MRIAGLTKNDTTNGEGICVSLWVQGCPHHCKGCHNPESWDFNGGEYVNNWHLIDKIAEAITANGIQRNFSILGGEPFAPQNINDTYQILWHIKEKFPSIKTFVWTGYTLKQIKDMYEEIVLENIDVLIDGPFIKAERDITLKFRGSKNQRILYKGVDY
jgi:anaerobic ribonucleoside-triphosphate reductase activating protein